MFWDGIHGPSTAHTAADSRNKEVNTSRKVAREEGSRNTDLRPRLLAKEAPGELDFVHVTGLAQCPPLKKALWAGDRLRRHATRASELGQTATFISIRS